ncbi:1-deoxy-D-xylulose-5-phosphate reductoisomerase [Wolbachia endosymbiont of Pentidionis agamae]|uniref:1-deoxy-D-xylulose-5-phosphate reductoisomerase n=1 Tax=Wolbachia endosymbiont of Pentidionis agamae TaxID=3110435 RepID=UPI002FCFFEE2
MKRVSVLGSTGNIGKKTVELLAQNLEKYHVEALTTHSNFELLAFQAKLLKVKHVAIVNEEFYLELKNRLSGTNINIEVGINGLMNIASFAVDLSVVAVVGIAGLEPVMRIIESGTKVISIANKESIVCGGKLLFEKAKKNNVSIIPIDSEHNAIFQILEHGKKHVEKIILTASGGPFLNSTYQEIQNSSIEQVLTHPTWDMGKKISVDSATMMNKVLEMIEAYNLFKVNAIEVVVHPESIVHSIVSYQDGFNFAVLAEPDMKIPISYALSWPERQKLNCKLDLTKQKKLTFIKPDHQRFPALKLGFEIMNSHSLHAKSIVLNAANEIAVNAFLNSQIKFMDIVKIVELTLNKFTNNFEIATLSNILEINKEARVISTKHAISY